MEVKELNQDHTVGKRVQMIILPIGGMNPCINKGMNGKITLGHLTSGTSLYPLVHMVCNV